MKRFLMAAGLAFVIAAGSALADGEPLSVDKIEEEQVRLLMLDVVVVDRAGRTVPDLTLEDFEVLSAGRVRAADTLDIDCPGGSMADARGVSHPRKRELPAAGEGRKVVIALDYLHLGPMEREMILDQAREMVLYGSAEGEQFMVAALTGGLRIEQPFTSDREQVLAALKRMKYDISLWAGNFSHLTEIGWTSGLTALLDVLGTVPGNKAVVLYSMMQDVPLDLDFRELAAIAAVSRCSIYPVDAYGLRPLPPTGPLTPG